MYDALITVGLLSLMVIFLSITTVVVLLTVRFFLLSILPLLAEIYGRIKYPNDFKE